MKLERSELGRLDHLAQGGQATVYRAPELSLPDCNYPLVVKVYKSRYLPISWVGLARLAMVRQNASPKERGLLDRYFTWPLRAVVEGSGAVGTVMPLLSNDFFHNFSSITGETRLRPREVQHLFVPQDRNSRVGLTHANPTQRLSICFEAARALAILHSTGLIYGDVSGDALRRSGSGAVVPQVETPDWDPPEPHKAQSEYTDRYKLGLMILRVLTPAKMTSTIRDADDVGPILNREGRILLRRALSHDRDRRTSAAEWVEHFRYVLTGQRPPSNQPIAAGPDATLNVPRVNNPAVSGGGWVRRDGQWEPA
jgi:hypothetical protein